MKKLIALILTLAMAFALCACGASGSSSAPAADSGSTAAASTETRVLQLGHLDPSTDTNAYQIFCLTFKDKLKEISN